MIRFGIVGAGGIAQKFARDCKFADNAIVTAIASRSLEKANKFKNEFGIEFAFASYEEMAKSDTIDAVYIATPHNFHMDQSILFMSNKKHVLCEKPIAVNVEQFEKMVVSSKENKVLLMEAMWTRFLPATLKIREVVQSKTLGKLKHAALEFGFAFMDRSEEEGRLFDPNLAGGSLLDVGIYPVAFTLNITDKAIKSLRATAKFHTSGVDTETITDLVFEDDSTARLVSSFMDNRSNKAVLEYENGNIISHNFWSSESVTVNNEVFDYPHINEGFEYQITSFVETLENGQLENDIMTHDQSRKSMQMLDKIRKVIGLKYPFE